MSSLVQTTLSVKSMMFPVTITVRAGKSHNSSRNSEKLVDERNTFFCTGVIPMGSQIVLLRFCPIWHLSLIFIV